MSEASDSINRSAKHSGGGSGVAPSARALLSILLTVAGLASSAWAYQFGGPDGPLLYWGILPGAPFAILAAMAFFSRVPIRATLGAAAGSLLVLAVPYGSLLYASANYGGGGANIGLGLLLLVTPVFLPIAMLFGGAVAYRIGKSRHEMHP